MKESIPVLITLDIHSYPDTEKDIPRWIERTLEVFNNLSIKSTFLFPAIFAEQFASYVRMILKEGHEIGCHGLTHGMEEQYNLLPYERQKAILYEAKKRLEETIFKEVISFRAPLFKINGDTIRALEENGFKADLSVNPQRFGIFSSDLTNLGWMYSPRKPYHPNFNNPFRKGSSFLWEIPQSAFIAPFTSNTGIAFGEAFMKLFFKFLYLESNFKSNPIVYMVHVEDIYPREIKYEYKFAWKHLLPSRTTGFMFRRILFHNKDGRDISRQIINLLKIIKASERIKFVTVREMLNMLNQKDKI